MGPESGPDIPTEIQDKARALVAERFAFAGTDGAFLSSLAAMGEERIARDMCVHPMGYAAVDVPEPGPLPPGLKNLDAVRVLQMDTHLPSAPQVLVELQEVIASERGSADDLARIISKDVGLSAILLRMVNSALYSFPSQIETISRAVALVGTAQISTLAVGTSVLKKFKDIPNEVIDLVSFWRHSVAVGLIGRAVARLRRFPDPERYFVAGLLHDIGRLVIFKAVPELGAYILSVSAHRKMLLLDAETEALGYDHARLGGMLLRKWNFPFSIVMAVLNHHSPSKVKDDNMAVVTHLADIIAKGLGHGAGRTFFVPQVEPEALERVGLDEADLEAITRNLEETLDDFVSMLS